MIAFIDDHHDAYGVEPICRVLPIAPNAISSRSASDRYLPDKGFAERLNSLVAYRPPPETSGCRPVVTLPP